MAKIEITGFKGANFALEPSLLPAEIGVMSVNHRTGRGDLRPWKAASTVAGPVFVGSPKTIYRMGRSVASDTNYWLSWTTNVYPVRGFNADDPSERTYYTGSGTPKWTDNIKALASTPYPTSSRELGIPAPASAPVLVASTPTITAGSFVVGNSYVIVTVGTTDFTLVGAAQSTVGTIFTATGVGTGTGTVRVNTDYEYRSYVYTYVSDVGEESAPSPAGTVYCRESDTVTLSSFASVPAGNYGVNRVRVYRTATGSTTTDFYFLKELGTVSSPIAATAMSVGTVYTIASIGTTDFTLYGASAPAVVGESFVCSAAGAGTGTVTSTTLSLASTTDVYPASLGEPVATTTWLPAPGVPQGGAYNFTEPTLSHLTGMWNGMMAGISGRAVRVCEAYVPYAWPAAYEILPSEASPVALGVWGQTLVVLTNAGPIAVTGGSPDSLDEAPVGFAQACVSDASVVSMTDGVVWASPDGLCFYGAGGPKILTQGIMTREDWQALTPANITGGLYEGRYVGFLGSGYTKNGSTVYGFVYDPANPAGLYFLGFSATCTYFDPYQDQLYLHNGTSLLKWDSGTALTTTFRSKEFYLPRPSRAASCAKVYASSYPTGGSATTFKLYVDGVLKHTQTVTSSDPFRLPGGYYATRYQIEVTSTVGVQAVFMADSIDELKGT